MNIKSICFLICSTFIIIKSIDASQLRMLDYDEIRAERGFNSPALVDVGQIIPSGNCLTSREKEDLIHSSHLLNLHTLNLSNQDIDDEFIKKMSENSSMERLVNLDLSGNPKITNESIEAILQSKILGSVRSLPQISGRFGVPSSTIYVTAKETKIAPLPGEGTSFYRHRFGFNISYCQPMSNEQTLEPVNNGVKLVEVTATPIVGRQSFFPPAPIIGNLEITIQKTTFFFEGKEISIDSLYRILEKHKPQRITITKDDHDADSRDIDEQNGLKDILKGLQEIENLRVLSLMGEYDDQSINLIGNIRNLEELTFENGAIINCSNYEPWRKLRYLRDLNLSGTKFALPWDANNPELRTQVASIVDKEGIQALERLSLSLLSLLNSLESLESLISLDLSSNLLFPPLIEKKHFNIRVRDSGKKVQEYMGWRADYIKKAAQLFASTFHGQRLIMRGTYLGGIFIEAFGENIRKRQFPPHYNLELDFSENYISLDAAVNFVIAVQGKNFKIHLSDNLDPKKGYHYSLEDVRDSLLEHFLGGVKVE